MKQYYFIIILFFCYSYTEAQENNRKKVIFGGIKEKTHTKDTIPYDNDDKEFKEWLKNEPHSIQQPGNMKFIETLPKMEDPISKNAQPPKMTMKLDPKVIFKDRLSEPSSRVHLPSENKGGAFAVGFDVIGVISKVANLISPNHETKKQRHKRKVKEILNNY